MTRIDRNQLITDFLNLGIAKGDTVLVRADLGKIGRIEGGANTFIEALLDAVGQDGTVVAPAYTSGSRRLVVNRRHCEVFTKNSKSYAGALPNAMLAHNDSRRSKHPMCSYVAIGKHANDVTSDHGPSSGAYEPIRKIINLDGKSLLVGCVSSSPGFTTAHLAEADLGYLEKLSILPRLTYKLYQDSDGLIKVFRRKDPGLCSNSFYKFYSHYIMAGFLRCGSVGMANSILAPSKDCYKVEYDILRRDQKFNICESPLCFTCNARRWDRLHAIPLFGVRLLMHKVRLMSHPQK